MDASNLGEMDVEVRRENNAYYKAYVIDVFEDEVVVVFENGWLPITRFPFSEVRLGIEELWDENFHQGDEIEVSLRHNEEKYSGWWSAIIKMIKGRFAVVQYHGFEVQRLEIIPLDWVRHKNPNPPITHTTFLKLELAVPEELREYSKDHYAYKKFQIQIQAPICRYIPEKGTLSIISRYERPIKNAVMLEDVLFNGIFKKVRQLKLDEEEKKDCAAFNDCQNTAQFIINFSVDKDLFGAAVGFCWTNYRKARKLAGISEIKVGPDGTFTILSNSEEALKNAQSILQVNKEFLEVKKSHINQVIGLNCQNLQDILSIEVTINDKPQPILAGEEELVSLKLIGNKETISNVKLMLDNILSDIEVEDIRKGIGNITNEMCAVQPHNETQNERVDKTEINAIPPDEETKHVSVCDSDAKHAPVQSCSTEHDRERPEISSTKRIIIKRTRKQMKK